MMHSSDKSSRLDSRARTAAASDFAATSHARAASDSSAVVRQLAVSVTPESPALIRASARSDTPAAYELKCLIDASTMRQLESYLRGSLIPDPYSQLSHDGHYQITTVSTDTPGWSVFHREPGFAARKFRLRRYGDDQRVYLEQKTRRGSRVRKQRSQVLMDELKRLNAPCNETTSWSGDWFASHVQRRQLRPVCVISCERKAWFGKTTDGTMRLTFDRGLRAALITDAADWRPIASSGLMPVAGDRIVCEFKFCGTMPLAFKNAIQELGLLPGGFSKFRNCVSVLTGLQPVTATQRSQTLTDEAQDGTTRHA